MNGNTKTTKSKGSSSSKKRSNCSSKVKSIDAFGETFNFQLPEGHATSRHTFTGMCITFLAIFVIMFFAAIKLKQLIVHDGPQIMVSTSDGYFDTEHEFTSNDGFMVAFALSAFDSVQEPIDDASYGQLKAYYKKWGFDEQHGGVHFEPVETSQCTKEQLNLPDDEDHVFEPHEDHEQPAERLFFEPHKNAVGDALFYQKKFQCIKKPDLRIQGDYNSRITRSFVLLFEKCVQENESTVQCKSDQEIKEWLQRKFIVTYTNSRRFVLTEFGEDKVVPEARTNWIPINSQLREEVVFTVHVSYLQLQDSPFQWGHFTDELIPNIFKIKQQAYRPYEFKDNVHVQVTFELDLNLTVVDRAVYSFLDWLGDVGGLGEALFYMGTFIFAIFSYGQFDQMMIGALYRAKKRKDDSDKPKTDRQSDKSQGAHDDSSCKGIVLHDDEHPPSHELTERGGKEQSDPITQASSLRILCRFCFSICKK